MNVKNNITHIYQVGFPEDFARLGYKCWVFPNFHKKIGFGAFFAIKSKTSIIKKRLEGLDEIFEGEFWI